MEAFAVEIAALWRAKDHGVAVKGLALGIVIAGQRMIRTMMMRMMMRRSRNLMMTMMMRRRMRGIRRRLRRRRRSSTRSRKSRLSSIHMIYL